MAATSELEIPIAWCYDNSTITKVWNWLELNSDVKDVEIVQESTQSYFRWETASENVPYTIPSQRVHFTSESYTLAPANHFLIWVYAYLFNKKVRNKAALNCGGMNYTVTIVMN